MAAWLGMPQSTTAVAEISKSFNFKLDPRAGTHYVVKEETALEGVRDVEFSLHSKVSPSTHAFLERLVTFNKFTDV